MRATFQTLAEMDLEAAEVLYKNTGNNIFNMSSLHARQAVEKYLKFLLASSVGKQGFKLTIEEVQDLLKSHNLRKIMYSCMDIYTDLYKLKSEIINIADIYFQVNYPGDFITVEKHLAFDYLTTARKVKECCVTILNGGRY